MNQRIRELADEAAKFSAIMALPTGEAGNSLFVEKFAELLVNEICKIVQLDGEILLPMIIKEHFGVEE